MTKEAAEAVAAMMGKRFKWHGKTESHCFNNWCSENPGVLCILGDMAYYQCRRCSESDRVRYGDVYVTTWG